jgi:hypothetical protein
MEKNSGTRYADSQAHKAHRGVSQKIQKRRDQDKKKKKEKKVRDEKGKKNKDKRTKRLEKYAGKLKRLAGQEWEDVLSIFSSLDEGHEVKLF